MTLFLCLFFLYPFLLVSKQAFSTGAGVTLDNFREVTSYWKFPITMRNTLLLAAAVVPIQLALALLMATMVNRMKKGRDLVLYVWTIPLGISDLAAGIIWLAHLRTVGVPELDDERPRTRRQAGEPVDLPEPRHRVPGDHAWPKSGARPRSCW